MKFIFSSLVILSSLSAYACPTVNMTNLICTKATGEQYTINSVVVQNNKVSAVIEGELMEIDLPTSVDGAEYKCEGNSIVTIEKELNFSVKSVISFNNNGLEIKGTRFVWQCDSSDCESDQNYYIVGTEAFADICVK